MTPAPVSPLVVSAAKRVLSSGACFSWPSLWRALENFSAQVLYELVMAGGAPLSDIHILALLQEQLELRALSNFMDASRDIITVLRGDASLLLSLDSVVFLGKRLKALTWDALQAECKALVPPLEPHSPKLGCPVAWLLTDKGCTKSQESEQVLKAARRLTLAEEPIPYAALLSILHMAYTQAQAQLALASSRTKIAVDPIIQELLTHHNLTSWRVELQDVMVVLGTAPHVNRRRALRALAKVEHLDVGEVMRQIQVAARQSDLIELLEDGDHAWGEPDSDSSS